MDSWQSRRHWVVLLSVAFCSCMYMICWNSRCTSGCAVCSLQETKHVLNLVIQAIYHWVAVYIDGVDNDLIWPDHAWSWVMDCLWSHKTAFETLGHRWLKCTSKGWCAAAEDTWIHQTNHIALGVGKADISIAEHCVTLPDSHFYDLGYKQVRQTCSNSLPMSFSKVYHLGLGNQGSGWFRMVQDGSGWFRMVQDGSGWFRYVGTILPPTWGPSGVHQEALWSHEGDIRKDTQSISGGLH